MNPQSQQSRAIQTLALWAAVLSLAGAIEWPRIWPSIVLADLVATSVFCALVTGHQNLRHFTRCRR